MSLSTDRSTPAPDWNPLQLLNDGTSPKDTEPTEEATAYVVFKLSGQWLAVDVRQVREILDKQPITPVPNAPHDVQGIIDIRGRDVLIVDLAQHLGTVGLGEDDAARIVVFEFQRPGATPLPVGVLTEAVRDVVRLADDAIIDPPEALSRWDQSLLLGVTRLDGRPLVVLNLFSLFEARPDLVVDDAFDFA